MPEFILESSGRVDMPAASLSFSDLDEFTQGYIEALFFTSECPQVGTEEFKTAEHQEAMREGAADGVLPCDVGFADLAPETLQAIIADCRAWQEANAELLAAAYNVATQPDYDAAAAGRDFWYTRNGHGVGFWDRGLGQVGDKLSAACRYRELNPYFGDDEKVYLS
ncbi:MAG: hypothetical protein E5W06_00380 [Mesorhizobium sp.]|nr:MAG: hypothetical protein E5W06_00380 [Mesorhizobium sp.]